MAVVKGPLFSLDASGTVGGAVVYSTWKGRSYVRRHAVPANPKSAGQQSVRAMLRFLSQYWESLSTVQQAVWEARAAVTNISPFNAFIAYNMTRWGLYDSPSIADPAAEDDTQGTLANQGATAGSRSIDVQVEVTVLQDNWGIAVHRDLTTGFTPSRNNVVRVIPALIAQVEHWLDFPLTPAVQQFYRFSSFSEAGVFSTLVGQATATPTA